jgi:transcription-repair coupling factor (superfamily II helicase)
VQLVVTTVRATAELTRMPRAIARARLDIGRAEAPSWGTVVDRLEAMGYERRPSVTDVAQYAIRGGIVDVYGFGMADPARLEWWGDELISIRTFDLDTQRSRAETDAVTILPVRPEPRGAEPEATTDGGGQTLLDLLPADTLIVVDASVEVEEVRRVWSEAQHHLEVARRRGEDPPGRDALLLAPTAWEERWTAAARLELSEDHPAHRFPIGPPPPIARKIAHLRDLARRQPTLVLCDNEGQLERLDELLAEGTSSPWAR